MVFQTTTTRSLSLSLSRKAAAVDIARVMARCHARHETSHLPLRVSFACLGWRARDDWPVLCVIFGRLGEKLSVHECHHHHSLARCHEELFVRARFIYTDIEQPLRHISRT
jgi:hypothetical protein